MTASLIFLDTETTGLSLYADIWELAAIRREPDGTETELHLFIEHDRAKCARLPDSFREDHYSRYRDHMEVDRTSARGRIREFIGADRPHIVGAVPNFDTERLAKMYRDVGSAVPEWHHRLRCVETLTAGYLRRDVGGLRGCMDALGLPFDEAVEHTALGDVHAARAIWDHIMGGAS